MKILNLATLFTEPILGIALDLAGLPQKNPTFLYDKHHKFRMQDPVHLLNNKKP